MRIGGIVGVAMSDESREALEHRIADALMKWDEGHAPHAKYRISDDCDLAEWLANALAAPPSARCEICRADASKDLAGYNGAQVIRLIEENRKLAALSARLAELVKKWRRKALYKDHCDGCQAFSKCADELESAIDV